MQRDFGKTARRDWRTSPLQSLCAKARSLSARPVIVSVEQISGRECTGRAIDLPTLPVPLAPRRDRFHSGKFYISFGAIELT